MRCITGTPTRLNYSSRCLVTATATINDIRDWYSRCIVASVVWSDCSFYLVSFSFFPRPAKGVIFEGERKKSKLESVRKGVKNTKHLSRPVIHAASSHLGDFNGKPMHYASILSFDHLCYFFFESRLDLGCVHGPIAF